MTHVHAQGSTKYFCQIKNWRDRQKGLKKLYLQNEGGYWLRIPHQMFLYEYMFVYLCIFAFEYLCICRMKEGSDWEFPNKGGCIRRWQWKTTLPLALKALNSLTGPTRCPGTPGVLMMNKNIAMKITFLSASQIGGKRLNYINDPLALIIGYQGIHVPQL